MAKRRLPETLYCRRCGGKAVLIRPPKKFKGEQPYYYHYSICYDLGCHQRIPLSCDHVPQCITELTPEKPRKNVEELVEDVAKFAVTHYLLREKLERYRIPLVR